jgi:hypothetical protein
MTNYIEPIRTQLDEKMNLHCSVFITIGSPKETPRYYNFNSFDEDTKVLKISSSQNSRLFFEIQTNFDEIDCAEFWPQFKEYRTTFLKENYPTIETI